MRTVDVSTGGGPVTATITIGFAQFGKYALYRFESDKTTFAEIGRGETPAGPESFLVGDGANLAGKYLSWDAVIVPISGSQISVTLRVTQGGQPVATFVDDAKVPAGKQSATVRASARFV